MSQPNVWIIDHRDSFTWNLAELVRMTGMAVPRVVSNESPELEQAVQAGEKLILSPGPGTVEDACHRATFRLLDRLPRFTPVLGVCLGHQILGVRFGARLEHLSRPLHGAREVICRTEQCPLLEGLPEQFPAALYHSWRLAAFPWPAELIVTARDSGKTCRPSATGTSPLRHSVPSGIHPDAGRRSAAPELPVPSGRQQGKTAHQMIQFQPPGIRDERDKTGKCLTPVRFRFPCPAASEITFSPL